MKAAQLRQAILQAAVQGKLVPQNPQDESGELLLSQIKDQKEKLIYAGHYKEKLKFKPITTDDHPFPLPENWTWCRFGEATLNRDSERIPVSRNERQKRAKEYDYYGASGVIDKIDGYLFDKRLLLIGEDGANLLARSTPIAFIADGRYWVNNHAHVIDFTIDNLIEYFCLYINAIDLFPYVTGTAQPKMNQEKMNSIVVALPPLAEQQRIISKVNELMLLCDELEAAEKELDALESNLAEYLPKSILQAAVQGKLVPQNIHDEPASELLKRIQAEKARLVKEGKIKKEKPLPPITEDEIPYDLPDGWEWCRLGDLIQLAENNNIHSKLSADALVNYVDIESIDNEKYCIKSTKSSPVKSLSSRARRVLKKGYLVYSLVRPYLDNIAIIEDQKENHIGSTGLAVFKPIKSEAKFFMSVLLSPYIRDHYLSILSGFNSPSISQEDFLNTPFPLPPLAEQQRIVAKVEELMALCEQLKNIDTSALSPLDGIQKILPFDEFPAAVEPEERYGIAARGELAEKVSAAHRKARQSVFEDDDA